MNPIYENLKYSDFLETRDLLPMLVNVAWVVMNASEKHMRKENNYF